MKTRKDEIRELIEVMLCTLVIFAIVDYFNYKDYTILGKRESTKSVGTVALPQGQPYAQDDVRISNLFVEDTLPRLMHFGLVRKYELTRSRTTLFVDGKMWKQRSPFFKHCLLTEILVHNKLNGYSSETHVVDDQSRRLFAKISRSLKFAFYD